MINNHNNSGTSCTKKVFIPKWISLYLSQFLTVFDEPKIKLKVINVVTGLCNACDHLTGCNRFQLVSEQFWIIFEMRQPATRITPNLGNHNWKIDQTMVWFSSVHRTEPANTKDKYCNNSMYIVCLFNLGSGYGVSLRKMKQLLILMAQGNAYQRWARQKNGGGWKKIVMLTHDCTCMATVPPESSTWDKQDPNSALLLDNHHHQLPPMPMWFPSRYSTTAMPAT